MKYGKYWWKAALLMSAGTTLQLISNNGCLDAVMQRVFIAALFD